MPNLSKLNWGLLVKPQFYMKRHYLHMWCSTKYSPDGFWEKTHDVKHSEITVIVTGSQFLPHLSYNIFTQSDKTEKTLLISFKLCCSHRYCTADKHIFSVLEPGTFLEISIDQGISYNFAALQASWIGPDIITYRKNISTRRWKEQHYLSWF